MPLFDDLTITYSPDDNMHDLTEVLVGADSDEILIWDVSEGGYRKIKRSNLIKNLTIYGLSLADFLEITESVAPVNPVADRQRLYLTVTGLLRVVDELGGTRDIITTTDIQTMTNKTLTSPHLTTPLIDDGDTGLSITSADQTHAAPTATIPDLGDAADEFVMRDVAQSLSQKTLDTPHLDTPLIDGYVDFNEEAAPAAPGVSIGRLYYKTDHKFWYKDDLGIEKEIGSGGAGGINYCDNPDAEVDTTGWATYDDGAVAVPVDGDGGAPDSTFTRDTTSTALLLPLRGAASFLWDAGAAANRQGEGVSYDFDIDPIDQTKMCSISFDWLANCILAEGDFIVYIYDVTNSALIQPVPYKLPGTVANAKCSWAGEFQAAYNSVNYRFIIHRAVTTVTDFGLYFDNFEFGPNEIKQGVPVVDAVSKTMTISNITATITTFMSKMGQRARFEFKVTVTNAATGNITLGMPSGMSIDTASMPATPQCGIAQGYDATGNTVIGMIEVASATTLLIRSSANAVGEYWDADEPFTWANGDFIYGWFDVPILGWSSNCQVSNDAETRVVACEAYLSSDQTGIDTNSTYKKINFNAVSLDTHGSWDTAAYKYVVKVPGIYQIECRISLDNTNILAARYWVDLYVNGVGDVRRGEELIPESESYVSLPLHTVMNLKAGDYLEFYVVGVADHSVNKLTAVGGVHLTRCSIVRLSGPSQIAASEKVYVHYTTNAGQNITSGLDTLINFEDKVNDSHGAVTIGASWKFTAPKAGIVNYSAGLCLDMVSGAFDGTGERIAIHVYKNGVKYHSTSIRPSASSVYPNISISGSDYANAGDYYNIYFYQDCGETNALYAGSTTPYNHIMFSME